MNEKDIRHLLEEISEEQHHAPEGFSSSVTEKVFEGSGTEVHIQRRGVMSRFYTKAGLYLGAYMFPFAFLTAITLLALPYLLGSSGWASTLSLSLAFALCLYCLYLLSKMPRRISVSQRMAFASGLLSLAAFMFVSRASVSLFFGADYVDFESTGSGSGGQTASSVTAQARDAYGDLIVAFKNDIDTAKKERSEMYNVLQRTTEDMHAKRKSQPSDIPAAKKYDGKHATIPPAENIGVDKEVLRTAKAVFQPLKRMPKDSAQDEKAREDYLDSTKTLREVPIMEMGFWDKTLGTLKATQNDRGNKVELAKNAEQKYAQAYTGTASEMQAKAHNTASQFDGLQTFGGNTASLPGGHRQTGKSMQASPYNTADQFGVPHDQISKRKAIIVDQLVFAEPPKYGDGYVDRVTQLKTRLSDTHKLHENKFLTASSDPLSTFSIDVDTASYTNTRQFLRNSILPPRDTVRIEEFVNYFSYDYPEVTEKSAPFAIATQYAVAPWNSKHKLLRISLQGYEPNTEELPPSNLVFLIDVSGSMSSANKLPLLKSAFKLLVSKLNEKDRVSIVTYAGNAGEVLPPTSGEQSDTILAAIDRLNAGGSTAGGAGIELAYELAAKNFIDGGNNRVILATDGDFNVGISDNASLVRLIERKRESGIFLSVLGFGTGNYKDTRMEQLANKGNGNYAYIDNAKEAKKVLVEDVRGTLFTIAKDVKIQIEFNPARVQSYRLLGYENRLLAKEDFNDDTKDAGDLGAGHRVTAFYEIVPVGVEDTTRSVDPLKYQSVEKTIPHSDSDELATVKLRYKLPDGNKSKLLSQTIASDANAFSETSSDFRFASSVVQFAMILRDSRYKGSANLESTLEIARKAKGADPKGYRREFIELLETAQILSK